MLTLSISNCCQKDFGIGEQSQSQPPPQPPHPPIAQYRIEKDDIRETKKTEEQKWRQEKIGIYDMWNNICMVSLCNENKHESLTQKKRINSRYKRPLRNKPLLGPSEFSHGCVCGHGTNYRDISLNTKKRKNIRPTTITIQPKIKPMKLLLVGE